MWTLSEAWNSVLWPGYGRARGRERCRRIQVRRDFRGSRSVEDVMYQHWCKIFLVERTWCWRCCRLLMSACKISRILALKCIIPDLWQALVTNLLFGNLASSCIFLSGLVSKSPLCLIILAVVSSQTSILAEIMIGDHGSNWCNYIFQSSHYQLHLSHHTIL